VRDVVGPTLRLVIAVDEVLHERHLRSHTDLDDDARL
jgi:hypothetical protein